MNTKVLRVNLSGLPLEWISPEESVTLKFRGGFYWESGETIKLFRSGFNASGERTEVEAKSIIAVGKNVPLLKGSPFLSNESLFRRDRHICLYCGEKFASKSLTCDHVIPKSRGGLRVWENSVTACYKCNQRKADRTPEEAGMKLLAIPYLPNRAEYLILTGRNILADQMEFLEAFCRKQA